jgi:hypothetical protein
MASLTPQQQTAVAAVDRALDEIFRDGIPSVVTGVPGYAELTSQQKVRVRNTFDSVVAAMLAAGAVPNGLSTTINVGTFSLVFNNGILLSATPVI